MKNKYRNIFLLFGIAAIIIMLLSFDMDYKEVWHNLKRAGYWFPAILLLWVFIYMVNALSWYNIIRDGEKSPISYLKVYKLTVTGFALNYATPGGLMGGEPYRVMELTPYVGASKATSSVILYVMMHIFSHICFWFASIFLYIVLYPVNAMLGAIFVITGFVLLFLIYLFLRGYSKGMAVKTIRFLGCVPFAKNWARGFSIEKKETLKKIDLQIAELH
ncbi:MAG: lysylphosphatidylglycerol synthase transmembrane domain-containing protein, partial [Phocaeicola sp.]|uniref:lysylphosphatidylglycerol synthase transmembrane domain-containing protein n=1 Tax=Phocaeicola sp. TaxID=2773926 RepID=UPI003F9F4B15